MGGRGERGRVRWGGGEVGERGESGGDERVGSSV